VMEVQSHAVPQGELRGGERRHVRRPGPGRSGGGCDDHAHQQPQPMCIALPLQGRVVDVALVDMGRA
ncbi:hypothetical protein AB0J71_49855, partial [Nonomuraea sp. NPDC049637]|uniref:hypothetical protein n=1 Tax=Nonomuraea sp. NPDC049637 TaxID=3154356 RepID=UPI00342F3EC9